MIRLLALLYGLIALPALAQQKEEYTVVVGSRESYADAELLLKLVIKKGAAAVIYKSASTPVRYRVCSGRYANGAEALRAKERLTPGLGYSDMWVMKLDAANQAVPPSGVATVPTANLPATVANPTPPIDKSPTPPPTAKAAAVVADTVRFAKVYATITQLMQADQRLAMDAFIHPEQGLYVLYNPGAHVVAEQVRTYQDIFLGALPDNDAARAQFAQDLRALASAPPTFGPLPMYDCKGKTYEHLGAFCTTLTDADRMLARFVAAQKEFAIGEQLTPAERQAAQQADANLKIAVVNTHTQLIRTLYFAKIEGRWYLAVLDLVSPCGN